MTARLQINDIPESGLVLIGPDHHDFDSLVSSLLNRNPRAVVEAHRSLAVVLRNTAQRPLVVYILTWELIGADGTASTYQQGCSVIWTLMDGVVLNDTMPAHDLPHIIMPDAARVFSPVVSFYEEGASVSANFIHHSNRHDERGREVIGQAMRSNNLEAIRQYALAHVPQYRHVSVRIDGAFFDDGLFVGINRMGLFETTKAQVKGKHDLLLEIARGVEAKLPWDEVFSHVEALMAEPGDRRQHPLTPQDHYRDYQKLFAKELANIRWLQGDQRAVDYVLQKLARPWVELRRQRFEYVM